MAPRTQRALDAVLWLAIVTGFALSLLAFFAGSIAMAIAAAPATLIAILARAFGKPRIAYAAAMVGAITCFLTWRAATVRHDVAQFDHQIGRQRLRSGADPSVCTPAGEGRDLLVFTMKPDGYPAECRALDPGISVQIEADPHPPQAVGSPANQPMVMGQPYSLREATPVEQRALGHFHGTADRFGGAWSSCESGYCTLVFRWDDLVVRANWSIEEAGDSPPVIAELLQSRLGTWKQAPQVPD